MTKHVTMASWDDVPHLTEEQKQALYASIPPYQRDARTKGIPQLGAGAIYPVPESEITVQPFEIPAFWPGSYALDVGWNKTAAVFQRHDPDNDIVYLVAEYYQGQAEPPVHANGIRARGGSWMHGVIDPAARGRQQKDGTQLFSSYVDLGLTLSLADNAVEAGLYEVWTRLSTGRLKVFKTLQNWFAEYRLYRRDENGKIVKQNDHLMDCTRYLVNSGLKVEGFDPKAYKTLATKPTHRIDYDPMSEAYSVAPRHGRR